MKKIISSILVLAMLLGTLMVLPFVTSAYENGETPSDLKIDYTDVSGILTALLKEEYVSAQDKIDRDENMYLYVTYGRYELYANPYSAEVYVKDTVTGEILTTNPYDYSAKGMPESAKEEFMSQVVLQYSLADVANGKTTKLYSFTESAKRGQITISAIQNGIRVNYVLGDTTKRYILPASIPAQQMVEDILAPAQRNLERQLRELAEENKVPEADLNTYHWDYKLYYIRYATRYDLTDLIGTADEQYAEHYGLTDLIGTAKDGGTPYVYGNPYAFEKWYKDVASSYKEFYNSKAGTAEQAAMDPPSAVEDIISDYRSLMAVYTLISPYNHTMEYDSGSPNREDWPLLPDRLGMDKEGNLLDKKDWAAGCASYIEYLRSDAYEDENGTTVYPHSFFALDDSLTATQMQDNEKRFLSFVPNFTEDMMYEAENTVGLTMPPTNNAIFRVSLEYILDEDGLTVTMPAAGIVYDETQYTVDFVSLLPYFGSAKIQEGGFLFYPDGSGAIVDLDDYQTKASSISAKVFGQDYAYYSLSGKHQQTIALPVYGTVRNECTYYMVEPYKKEQIAVSEKTYREATYTITYDYHKNANGEMKFFAQYPFGEEREVTQYFDSKNESEPGKATELVNDVSSPNHWAKVFSVVSGADAFGISSKKQTGYVAILEDGASLATLNLKVNDAGNYSRPYTAVYPQYTPRPCDQYNLADVMSGAESTSFGILADGKYLGDYTIRYAFLTSDDVAAASGITEYYPTTYSGMAAAYQAYLVKRGVLTALTNLQSDLPLYIESFGMIETIEKRLSIPTTVETPLTTFEDIQTMYEELSGHGVSNIKFRLTGFANGGLEVQNYPVKLKWEKAVGGKSGFKKLLAYVAEEDTGLEVFPNFTFLTLTSTKNIKLKEYGARSVDNRYAWKQTYSAVYQNYVNDEGIIVSTDKLTASFEKFERKYGKYGTTSLSLDGMASQLSSNFNEDNFIDRETSEENIAAFLKKVRDSGYTSLMSTGGNAYALRYMDYLLEAPLGSSHYNATSYSVPFWGMVMHGYLQYAGDSFNEEANKSEAFLRAIESGASLYFLLSYQNTQLLKDSTKSDYYSVNYQITKDSVVEYYLALNAAIGDLQTYRIVEHIGLIAERERLASEIEEQRDLLEEEFLRELASAVNRSMEEEKELILAVMKLENDSNIDWTKSYAEHGRTTGQIVIRSFIDTYQNITTLRGILGPESDYTGTTAERYGAKWDKVRAAVADGSLFCEYGKSIGVTFDTEAVIASAQRALYTDTLDADFEARIRAYMTETAKPDADVVARVADISYSSEYSYFTTSDALDEAYVATASTVDNNSVVMVTYSDGTHTVRFLLNYNIFGVNIRLGDTVYSLAKYGYLRID